MTDLERENRRLQGELLRAREDIAELKERLAYALLQVRELSARFRDASRTRRSSHGP